MLHVKVAMRTTHTHFLTSVSNFVKIADSMSLREARLNCTAATDEVAKVLGSRIESLSTLRKPPTIIEQIKFLECQLEEGKEIDIPRSLFSDSRLGELAYSYISNGEACARFISRESGDKCQKRGLMTIDFDHSGDCIQLVVCSLSDYREVEKAIENDFKKEGRYTVFGINGFGREWS